MRETTVSRSQVPPASRDNRLQAETTLFASRKSFTSTTRSTSAVRWFLEEDDGEAELAKSEMMVASSMLCDLMPHCFVICDRRDRGRLSSLYYTCIQAREKEERRCIFLFLQSINQGA